MEDDDLFLEDGVDLLDNTDTEFIPLDWREETALQFAEWFGYDISPNPESTLGFRVTAPSGKVLGGFVAKNIIEAYNKNPTGEAVSTKISGANPGGKKAAAGAKGGGGKAAGAAKAPAKPKKDPAVVLQEAKDKASESILGLDVSTMVDKSKGKLDGQTLNSFVDAAKAVIANSTDPAEVRKALSDMRKNISRYKSEMLKPPTKDQILDATKTKLKESFPTLDKLGVTDVKKYQALLSASKAELDSATSPEAAKEVVKKLKAQVSEMKKIDAAVQKAAGQEAVKLKGLTKSLDYKQAQEVVKMQGWQTAEVVKGNSTDLAAYQKAVEQKAKNDPANFYSVMSMKDGTFALVVKPRDKVAATTPEALSPPKNLLGVMPKPAPPKKEKPAPKLATRAVKPPSRTPKAQTGARAIEHPGEKSGEAPKSMSEWADFYVEEFFPMVFHAGHDNQKSHGRRGSGGGGGGEDDPLAEVKARLAPGAKMFGGVPQPSEDSFGDVMKYRSENPTGEDGVSMDEVKSVLPHAAVKMRIPIDDLMSVIEEGGLFKNQFDTNDSQGALNPDYRALQELAGFGLKIVGKGGNTNGTPNSLTNPKYGYIDHPSLEFNNRTIASYGTVELKMKESIKDRTSFTTADSLGVMGETLIPAPIKSPHALALMPYPSAKPGGYHYWEAQIHGKLTIKDVEQVVFRVGEVSTHHPSNVANAIRSTGWRTDSDLISEQSFKKLTDTLDQEGISWMFGEGD